MYHSMKHVLLLLFVPLVTSASFPAPIATVAQELVDTTVGSMLADSSSGIIRRVLSHHQKERKSRRQRFAESMLSDLKELKRRSEQELSNSTCITTLPDNPKNGIIPFIQRRNTADL